MKDGVQRIDKWLWFARVAKTRTLAAKLVAGGGVRVNKVRTDAPATAVRVGDVLTIAVARSVRVLKVAGLGERRGPAPEAALLYEDLSEPVVRVAVDPVAAATTAAPGEREPGSGRPTKRERRQTDRLEPGPGDD
ncbi:RNA-binding S4 domain-containing protein [Methylobrevis albus]|uniref:RNA-binding S4 domain-containing protein n=1 Tax=Methylobrevis albus TaxID=2793297 RepID=A0A931I0X1_9HYPH|nr:RNA-binding S4 domain-containing protein [Methylobrevis albus]MBH0237290.1 RNA-binding S4 domain-containing protein [Methylobrevis albus]